MSSFAATARERRQAQLAAAVAAAGCTWTRAGAFEEARSAASWNDDCWLLLTVCVGGVAALAATCHALCERLSSFNLLLAVHTAACRSMLYAVQAAFHANILLCSS